ncbi:MAG: hypothetical protein ACRDB9_06520 [Cetobacterium sp.]
MFNIPRELNTKAIKSNIYDVKNIVYKLSTNTLLKADAAVQHIKRNKRIYKNIILYLAICLSPELIRCSQHLIVEFIRALAIIPKENLFDILFDFFREIALYLVSFLILKDVVINTFTSLVDKIKNN